MSMMISTDNELRKLMESYTKRLKQLREEEKEAKETGDVDAELAGELLQTQCRKMIAELFGTMENIGILSPEEIKLGAILKN